MGDDPKSELTPLANIVTPQLRKRVAGPTRMQRRLIDASAAIHSQPDAAERAFMARQLVLCTLPHRDPGDVPVWIRSTGNGALVIRSGWDKETNTPFGYPYGSIPRLLMFWIVTEAIRTQSRRLMLGRNLEEFARSVGLNTDNGRGKRSDVARLKDQMQRLFWSHIRFEATAVDKKGITRVRAFEDFPLASKGRFWWTQESAQDSLGESWIELGEDFYAGIKLAPVPLDMRALAALKNSPLALDLYGLISYRAFKIVENNLPPERVVWTQLRRQLGTEYGDPKDFKKRVGKALGKIVSLYPGLVIASCPGGFTVYADRLALMRKT